MADPIQAVIAGLGAGGLYALLGLAIVVVYRGSGLINFAAGGFALVGAIAFVELEGWAAAPTAVNVAGGVAAGSFAGCLAHLLVLRPMRQASPLARVIATLAMLSLAIESARLRYGDRPRFVPSFLPGERIEVAGADIARDRLLVLGLTVLLAVALWGFYRRSRFGCATAGVAENEQAVAALGWSPTTISTRNWAVGGALCGLTGVLLTSVVNNSLSPTSLTLSVVPALAAALIGGFASFPLTLGGGLLIGVLEAISLRYIDAPGWPSAVPFVVVVVVMVIRGRAVPLRSHRTDRLPRIGTGRLRPLPLLAAVGVVSVTVSLFTQSWTLAVTTSAIQALLCLSLVVVIGYCGQLSLAQLALAGVAALCTARLSAVWGLPLPVVLVASVVMTVLAGVAVALPAVRVRGVNLAVVTLGLSVVISAVVLSNPRWTKSADQFGVRPDLQLRRPAVFGLDLTESTHPERYALFSLAVLVLAGVGVANLRRSRTGRRLIAVRANERAAASIGIRVAGAKLYAFAVGAGLAGLAGVLIAYRNPTVQFDQFDVVSSINVVLLAVIGGIGSVAGGAIGGVNAATGIGEQALSSVVDLDGWFTILAAAGLLAVLVAHPDGLAFPPVAVERLRGRRSSPLPAAVPDDVSRSEEAGAPTAGARVTPRALEVTDLVVRFGALEAVAGISVTIEPGEIVGLIGPNGAGKTTFVDAVTGLQRATAGCVRIGDVDLAGRSPSARARAGLGRSFQSLELFEDLTVRDNLRVAAEQQARGGYLSDLVRPRKVPASAIELAAIREFRLDAVLDARPTELPYAQRRLVGIARAVAARPSVLLLDEPAAGLDEASTGELEDLVRRLARDWGMAVLLIEHDVSFVFGLCDRILVMDFGRPIACGPPTAVRADPAVVAAYLGAEVTADDEPPAVLT